MTPAEAQEALRDAASHLQKGTLLTDEAVRRICHALLALSKREDKP